ncbi:MAG: hypothetical protein WC384_10165 [Prolixibacteraceae bacterium]|jgi:hypothetical protein
MKELKYTLIADGSSDVVLLKIIKWLLDDLYPQLPCEGSFADFRRIPDPPKGLSKKVKTAKLYFPYNILFVHRDAESTTNVKIMDQRRQEIREQLDEVDRGKTICVVPIKMMETWLLINADAIKKAAGNRNYRGDVNLPSVKNLERENQPKDILHLLLKNASGLKNRGLKTFNVDQKVHLVADYIEDFSPLRSLTAFQTFEEDLKEVMDNYFNAHRSSVI